MSQMGESAGAITKQDLDRIAWRDVVEAHIGLEVHSMAQAFTDRAQIARDEGHLRASRAYELLANCVFLNLAPSDIANPLQVIANFGVRRTASIEDIATEDIDALVEFAPEIEHPELRARVSDIAWIRKRDYKAAMVAIEAYLEAAESVPPDVHWIHSRDYMERALRLSFSLGNGGKAQQQKTVAALIAIVEDRARIPGADLYPAHAMELLLSVGEGDAKTLKSTAEEMADRAFRQGGMGVETAEWYWRLAANWAQETGDTDETRRLRVRAAKAWADIADQYLGDHPNYLSSANYLLRSHTALRGLGEAGEAKKLEPRLFEIQELAMSEMKQFSTEIDLGPIISDMESRLEGSTLSKALAIFVAEIVGPSRKDVEKVLRMHNGDIGLDMLIGSHLIVDHRGRVVGKRASTAAHDEAAAPIDDELYHKSRLYREMIALGQIDTARRVINRTFRLTEYQLIGLLTASPFVPPGCERIFARGMMRGFAGDFISACSILVPQVESSMRYVLDQQEISTTRIDSEGIQEEMNLNTILAHEKIKEVFGDDLVFDLRGLLVARFGSNFRNRLTHGLVRDADFYSAEAIYTWWIVLKLCLFPFAVEELKLHSEGQSINE